MRMCPNKVIPKGRETVCLGGVDGHWVPGRIQNPSPTPWPSFLSFSRIPFPPIPSHLLYKTRLGQMDSEAAFHIFCLLFFGFFVVFFLNKKFIANIEIDFLHTGISELRKNDFVPFSFKTGKEKREKKRKRKRRKKNLKEEKKEKRKKNITATQICPYTTGGGHRVVTEGGTPKRPQGASPSSCLPGPSLHSGADTPSSVPGSCPPLPTPSPQVLCL